MLVEKLVSLTILKTTASSHTARVSIAKDTRMIDSNGKFDQNSIVDDTEKGKARRFVRPVNAKRFSICFCSFFVVSLY